MAPPVVRGQAGNSSGHLNILGAGARVRLVALGVGIASFLATEGMHFLLVPDIGRQRERLLAEGVSALLVALLTARLLQVANHRREAALLRMQVISEMNHHIRNALTAIALTAESTENQQCIRVISDSVDHIEWALREILLRRKPMEESEQERLRYFAAPGSRPVSGGRGSAPLSRQENTK